MTTLPPDLACLLAAGNAGGAALLVWLGGCLVPITLLAFVVGHITGRPYRQQVRSEFLLDVIESSLREGRPVEHRIVELAATRDPALGVPFHLLAAHLRRGHSLVPALERVPALAPPQLCAMLAAGQEMGDLGRVLPAGRALLRDGPSQALAAVNYQVLLAFVFNPLVLLLIPLLSVKVLPVLQDIAANSGRTLPATMQAFQAAAPAMFLGLLALVGLVYAAALVTLGGPRLAAWLEAGLPPLGQWLAARIPWRRKRLLRDFTQLLGLLLDAKVPESRAVRLAAQSTANETFCARAEAAASRLAAGEPLTSAVTALDDAGELRWRLRNAAHGAGFQRALAGWAESLEAQAFRQEQAAAQGITTALLLLNGLTVALVAATLFFTLIQMQAPYLP